MYVTIIIKEKEAPNWRGSEGRDKERLEGEDAGGLGRRKVMKESNIFN